MTESYTPLNIGDSQIFERDELVAIENGAYEILERIGMKLTEPRSRELLEDAGAKIDGDRVCLPVYLVKEAIEAAPESLTIYDQSGKEALALEGKNSYFGASMDGPNIVDPEEGEYRDCYENDIGWIVRLIDELPNISFLMPAGFAADHDSRMGEIVATKQCMINTDKPFVAITEGLEDLKAVHQMAKVKAGREFAEKPFFVNYAEPVSPLINSDDSARKILYCAEEEIPLLYSPFLAMGATSPQDPGTAVAQAVAESLFGLVLQHQVSPGGPFVLGGMPSMMDMGTANFSYGAPELQLMSSAITELGHRLGLPVFGTAGTGDSKLFDGQAIIEATSSSYMAAFSGTNLIHDVGLFGSAKILIPEMIVVVDEIVDLLRNTIGRSRIDEGLELDLLEEVGPGGEFVSHEHTLSNFRDSWYPRFVDRAPYENESYEDLNSLEDRVKEHVSGFLNEDHGEPSAGDDLRERLEEVEKEYSKKKLD